MTKKQTELSEELREAVFEAARAGAAEAYTQNTGYVNYFKAMETLLYNYKKLAALVADEEAYCEVEYHAGRKTFSIKTARRWRNKIVNDMAVCVFGIPAAVSAATYRKAVDK